jgi:hypothetical protein
VTFWLPDPSDLEVFRGMTARKSNIAGQRFMAVLVEVRDDETVEPERRPAPPKPEPNELAVELHRSGYFRAYRLWMAVEALGLYTGEEHKRYIESLRCCRPDESPCQGDVCAHHTNSAAIPAAGKGKNPRKPSNFFTVPLCNAHHMGWAHASTGATREDKQKLLEQAVHLTAKKMKDTMKCYLGIESLREITPEMLERFETEIGVR